ncbi:DDE-type integrase/transposase/recombinase [Pectobacterium brasiliense]|uniref:DDE-type integrase/transposase/recombinase n=1 Tax=Pectobacterium brasiliense TaxID=180957 RepID=UPI003DA08886
MGSTLKLKYRYKADGTVGQAIDFLLTAEREIAIALNFFRKTIRHHDGPEIVTFDKGTANTAVLAKLNNDKADEETITVKQRDYLNNRKR